jgi:hypothetical protein
LIWEKAEGTLVSNDDSTGRAGDSAHREYERRQARRVERARQRYGPRGALAANWIGDPNVEAWRQGASGEQHTARELAKHLRGSDVALLHDRRIPGRGRANIDHLAIGPAGVTVIDTKSGRGNVELATRLFSREELLVVNGRDRTRQLDALERQMQSVSSALERGGVPGMQVTGALCYPFMRRRWLHNSCARGGLIVVDKPRQIAKLTRRPGPLRRSEIVEVSGILERAFPSAG